MSELASAPNDFFPIFQHNLQTINPTIRNQIMYNKMHLDTQRHASPHQHSSADAPKRDVTNDIPKWRMMESHFRYLSITWIRIYELYNIKKVKLTVSRFAFSANSNNGAFVQREYNKTNLKKHNGKTNKLKNWIVYRIFCAMRVHVRRVCNFN